MNVDAALVREQGIDFAVVMINRNAMAQPNSSKNQLAQQFSSVFPGCHIVLCAQDGRGSPTYYGRTDIAEFCSNLQFQQLPWRRYQTTAV